MYVCVYTYMTYMYTYIHTYMYVHTYMYIHTVYECHVHDMTYAYMNVWSTPNFQCSEKPIFSYGTPPRGLCFGKLEDK